MFKLITGMFVTMALVDRSLANAFNILCIQFICEHTEAEARNMTFTRVLQVLRPQDWVSASLKPATCEYLLDKHIQSMGALFISSKL